MVKRLFQVVPIVSLLVGLTGVALAIYFHSRSIREPVPTFYVHPARATIVDASASRISELSVLHRGKPVGPKSVTAVRLYFWNDGKLPIRRDDVLLPVILGVEEPSALLDARILKVSREVSGLSLSPLEGQTKNLVALNFEILDHNDGAAIQLIFAGAPNSAIILGGVTVGAKEVKLVKSSSPGIFQKKTPLEIAKLLQFLANQTMAIVALLAAGLVLQWFYLRGRGEFRWFRRVILTSAVVILLFAASFGGYVYSTMSNAFAPGVPTWIWQDD